MADFYVAPYFGSSKLGADNAGLKDKFTGSTLGLNFGYKALFVAVEGGFRSSSVSGTVPRTVFSATAAATDSLSIDMQSFMTLFGGRIFFLFNVLDIHAGFANHSLDTKILLNNTDISSNSEFNSITKNDSGLYYGLGAQIPLPFIDIFANLDVFTLTSTAFIETVFGVRYYF